ncbi:MAG: hypothetical protein CMG25_07060 [Candidatus Marinimicrobia bacterium]|nr:hypothetical protein [Candidatus Neomarinimicrobiota bacterium]|tara:strand:- start:1262 stop:2053 length:792 start_codon:yes stop_codon:yes gene_type:complete
MIITIGASHGAFDKNRGKKILDHFRISNSFIFYFIYILIILMIVFSWIHIPRILTFSFIFISIYHFGGEDLEYYLSYKSIFLENILRGLIVLLTPLLIKTELTLFLFNIVDLSFPESSLIFIKSNFIFLSTILIGSIFYFIYRIEFLQMKILFLMETLMIFLIYIYFNPFVAFTIYFCFLHSPRHYYNSIQDLRKNLDFSSINQVNKDIYTLTLATVCMFMISFLFLYYRYSLNESIYIASIIGLASLTFPHIIVEFINNKIK